VIGLIPILPYAAENMLIREAVSIHCKSATWQTDRRAGTDIAR